MFILIISRGYPTAIDPQWGCFEKDQAEALCGFGHKVVVVSIDSRFRWQFRKIGITHIRKGGVDYFNSFWIPGKIVSRFCGMRASLYLRNIQLTRIYRRIVDEYGKPDLVYGQFFYNTYLGVLLKDKYQIPLVGIEHAARFNQNTLDSYTAYLASYAYSHTDAVITVSETLKSRLQYHFHIDSYVIHNLVGLDFCKSLSLGSRNGKVRFVSTGSLIHRKGYDLLIKAFERLNLPNDKWELLIIGDGEERANLQTQIGRVGLSDNIQLVGKKDKSQIMEILLKSDVFVLPSRSENFSVAVLEALCMGMPVVASICGGIKECVDSSNGLLFPVDDIDSLSHAIQEMYIGYSRYDRERIAQESRARFSPEVIAKQLTEVFEKTIQKYRENK